MDPLLEDFLQQARRTARREHLATYEDLACELEDYLQRSKKASVRLAASEFRHFLGYWYLRHHGAASWRSTRRFCAATRVLMRWLARQAPAKRRSALLRESRRLARDTPRAARASEMLESVPMYDGTPYTEVIEDYFEIVARGGSHVALRPLSTAASRIAPPVGPVALPAPLAASLDPGAFVNLQLGRAADRWAILDYGFCYPSSARTALCDALASESL